jgi:hypothetical protein
MLSKRNNSTTLNFLCQTYGLKIIGENQQEIFISCQHPILSLEKTINKLTRKTVNWQQTDSAWAELGTTPNETDHKLEKSALEKIFNSLLLASQSELTNMIRLEPGTINYRWRVYNNNGWQTLQDLPVELGQQLCQFIIKLAKLNNGPQPQISFIKFNEWQLKCHLSPVLLGTVIQLEIIKQLEHPLADKLLEMLKQRELLNLFYVCQRPYRQQHPLNQHFESLAKDLDIITIGEKLNDFDIVLPTIKQEHALEKIITQRPDLVVVNQPDSKSAILLAKKLAENNIKSLINIISHSPWPILTLINQEEINNAGVFLSLGHEMVCQQCKQAINPDKRLELHELSQNNEWLNNQIWENAGCDLKHKKSRLDILLDNWSGDIDEVKNELINKINTGALSGLLSWSQLENTDYFNF